MPDESELAEQIDGVRLEVHELRDETRAYHSQTKKAIQGLSGAMVTMHQDVQEAVVNLVHQAREDEKYHAEAERRGKRMWGLRGPGAVLAVLVSTAAAGLLLYQSSTSPNDYAKPPPNVGTTPRETLPPVIHTTYVTMTAGATDEPRREADLPKPRQPAAEKDDDTHRGRPPTVPSSTPRPDPSPSSTASATETPGDEVAVPDKKNCVTRAELLGLDIKILCA